MTELIDLRDSSHSQSRGVPLFLHCYDYLLPRNAPAGLGQGPWLYPALKAYKIPDIDWKFIGIELITRFKALLESVNLPAVYIIDTTGTLTPPAKESVGESGDWINEIHPNEVGYRKLAQKYASKVDSLFK